MGAPYTFLPVRPTGGTITSIGTNCGTAGSDCQVTVSKPTTILLEAIPDAGFVLSSWTGHCSGSAPTYALALNGNLSCGATFAFGSDPAGPGDGGALPLGPPYRLRVDRPAGGMVRGAGINCGTAGTTCSVSMDATVWIGLQATPDPGYVFRGWSGHCSSSQQNIALMLGGPRDCAASFAKAPSQEVAKTMPGVNWPEPATITEGTALSGAQLNATANVPG
jgi:hypothetical protein